MKLNNKVAIITGSSRGIGRATAILFAKEGAKVVVNYKTNKKAADEVVKIIGDNAFAIDADVTKEEEVKRSPQGLAVTICQAKQEDRLPNDSK